MAIPYTDLDSRFPAELDTIEDFIDPDLSSLSIISQYENAVASGNLSAAAQILSANPTLKRMIVNAENLNKIKDAIIAVQRYYLSDLQGYLDNVFAFAGNWSASVIYKKWNVVVYNGFTYISVVDNVPAGTLPTNTSYYRVVSIKGDKGDPGVNLVFKDAWSSAQSYIENDCVTYNNTLYAAKLANTNQTPSPSSGYWTTVFQYKESISISLSQPTTQIKNDIWIDIS